MVSCDQVFNKASALKQQLPSPHYEMDTKLGIGLILDLPPKGRAILIIWEEGLALVLFVGTCAFHSFPSPLDRSSPSPLDRSSPSP